MKERGVEPEQLRQYSDQRGGKVTDGLEGIRGKSGWVSDGNSTKNKEERVMKKSRGTRDCV